MAATPDSEGSDAVIHFAVSEKTIEASLAYVRATGTIVLDGLPPNAVVHSPVFPHVLRTLMIQGLLVGNREDAREAVLEFVRRGLVKCSITVVPMSELPKVFELMNAGKIAGRYVLDKSKF